jgi:transcriptional regulator of aromatic amino acid metabolism
MFNATFNNISVISWQSVLLVEDTGVPGENHWPAASHWQLTSTPCYEQDANSQKNIASSILVLHNTIASGGINIQNGVIRIICIDVNSS